MRLCSADLFPRSPVLYLSGIRMKRTLVACGFAGLLLGCSSARKVAEPTPTTIEVLAPAPTTTIAPTPDGCDPSDSRVIAAIERNLRDGGRLGESFTASDGVLFYISGNTYRPDGTLTEHGAVWVMVKGDLYALSGSANRVSIFDDGRDLPGNLTAGSDVAQAVEKCSTDSQRMANGQPVT